MVLGESLFLPNGELLLAAGYRFKEEYKTLLKKRGYASVLIEVEGTESVIPETVISSHLKREMSMSLSRMETDFVQAFSVQAEGTQAIEHLITENKHHLNKFLTATKIGPQIEEIIQEILSQPVTILNMADLLNAGSGLFDHAVNVAAISLCIAKKFNFTQEEMKQLGVGAIHCDLGMVAVPREILDKEDELTEEESNALRQHTVYGYLMLSQSPMIPPVSAAVSMQHHELQDGTGYPRGIRGSNRPPVKDFSLKNKINRFSEIVTVADTYELLVAGRRHYSRPHGAPDAMKMIIELGGKKLNSEIVKALVSIVPLYPTGARVRITRAPSAVLLGYCGVVAKNDPLRFSHPTIILYETRNHQQITPILVETDKTTGFAFELIP
jgi:HD-GYP domain-containing protein (c-di-GMP phosphodiesterase class II)